MSKEKALATHFEVSEEEITDEGQDTFSVSSEPGEYLVLTEDEAETAWTESLDNYLEECVLADLPTIARAYFNTEAWMRDAKLEGDRGASLSPYDGNEHEIKIDDEWFFIYRVH